MEVLVGTPGELGVPDGRKRTEARVLACNECSFVEAYNTVFVKPTGEPEVEVTPADVREIRLYHHNRTGHVFFTVKRPE